MAPLPIDIYDHGSRLLSKIKSYYIKETGTYSHRFLPRIDVSLWV